MFVGSKIKVGALLVMLTLLTFSLAGCSIFDGKTAEIQKNMSNYLRSTYGQEFVVKKPELMGNEGFGYRNYFADAYPKDQPDLKFSVKWDKSKPGIFEDNYLGTKWSKQGTEEMQRRLREVYGEDFFLKEYWISYNDKKAKELNFPEVISRNGSNMECDLYYFVFIDKDLDKQLESEKVYKLLKENFIDNKVRRYFIAVGYLSKDKKNQLFNIFNSSKPGDKERSMSYLYETNTLLNWLKIDYSKVQSDKYPEVKDITDVINKFQY